jgi:hypothetical protein
MYLSESGNRWGVMPRGGRERRVAGRLLAGPARQRVHRELLPGPQC